MAIEVRVPTIMRKHTGGAQKVSGAGATVREVVDDLETRHAGLRDALVGDDGRLHRFVNVYVNDEDVRFLGGMETPLSDGDTVSILPAVAGGG
ncbi:MAG: MoaD/ThiS family protein [Actinomycetota bacterium]|nr:MoaD/ThiS family protein [Actinomycetota bacterium]